LLVVSASQFSANPFARAGNEDAAGGGGDKDLRIVAIPYAAQYLTGSIVAFKSVLDWMADDAGLDICWAAPPDPKPQP
jgi:hypothetical protein